MVDFTISNPRFKPQYLDRNYIYRSKVPFKPFVKPFLKQKMVSFEPLLVQELVRFQPLSAILQRRVYCKRF
jgi:hypothetical protein